MEKWFMSDIFHRIVVPTDFSRCSEETWAVAQRLAASLGSELILVHVFVEGMLWSESPFDAERVRQVFAQHRKRVAAQLEEWAERARASGLTVRVAIRDGVPYQEIVAIATDERADLIAIGTAGRGGLNRALLGSVADRVVRLSPCPVLTVREATPATSTQA
jgi:nucleotide-binding universal stress UspA family protein